jgi:hypothetical protein
MPASEMMRSYVWYQAFVICEELEVLEGSGFGDDQNGQLEPSSEA